MPGMQLCNNGCIKRANKNVKHHIILYAKGWKTVKRWHWNKYWIYAEAYFWSMSRHFFVVCVYGALHVNAGAPFCTATIFTPILCIKITYLYKKMKARYLLASQSLCIWHYFNKNYFNVYIKRVALLQRYKIFTKIN